MRTLELKLVLVFLAYRKVLQEVGFILHSLGLILAFILVPHRLLDQLRNDY